MQGIRFIQAKGDGHMALRIQINEQGMQAVTGQPGCQGDRRSGLAYPSFLIRQRNDLHVN
ncbi:hypothetical protein SDC9_145175 [bioreactor metagenome]|uniref:Uncharacterized protein n=1 Tax=bioreactor metagenome TaxID=1076179 RepID=A0A645E7S9_9ZZZZ